MSRKTTNLVIPIVLFLSGCTGCPWGAKRVDGITGTGREQYCEVVGKDGKPVRHGPYRTFVQSSKQVDSTGQYDMGLRTGEWKYFSATGKLDAVVNFKNDVQNGEQTAYHPNGKPSQVTPYVDGKIQGVVRTWSVEGTPLGQMVYVNGHQTEGELFFAPGVPAVRVVKTPKGLLRTAYFPSGALQEREATDTDGNGTFEEWNLEGALQATIPLKHFEADGTWYQFYANGQKKRKNTSKLGNRVGPYAEWLEDGTLILEGALADEHFVGKCTAWNRAGQKLSEVVYDADGVPKTTTLFYGNNIRKTYAEHASAVELSSRTEFDSRGRRTEHYQCRSGLVTAATSLYYDFQGRAEHVEENESAALGSNRPCVANWPPQARLPNDLR